MEIDFLLSRKAQQWLNFGTFDHVIITSSLLMTNKVNYCFQQTYIKMSNTRMSFGRIFVALYSVVQ